MSILSEDVLPVPELWKDEIISRPCTGRIGECNPKHVIKLEQLKQFWGITASLEHNRIKFKGFSNLDCETRQKLWYMLELRKEYLFNELRELESCKMSQR